MKSLWVAGAGALMLGLADCGNTTFKTLQEDAEGRNFDPPPSGLASLYVYRDSDTGAGSMVRSSVLWARIPG